MFGTYGTITTIGAGCGDLNTSAPECIKGTTKVCSLHFSSVVQGSGTGALNGTADLQNDGTFGGAAVIFGTVQRTGCVGAWTAATSTIEVTCGGTGTSQSCTAKLVRTSTSCP